MFFNVMIFAIIAMFPLAFKLNTPSH